MFKMRVVSMVVFAALFFQTTHEFPAKDTNNVFTGTNQFTLGTQNGPVTFATLPTPPINGTVAYCSDCTQTNPCAGSGTGAMAQRINGAWNCSTSGGGAANISTLVGASQGQPVIGTTGGGFTVRTSLCRRQSVCWCGLLCEVPRRLHVGGRKYDRGWTRLYRI
jgi:hypothetical protein